MTEYVVIQWVSQDEFPAEIASLFVMCAPFIARVTRLKVRGGLTNVDAYMPSHVPLKQDEEGRIDWK